MMAVRVIEAVLLALGIEMSARGLEVRSFTLRHLMEVDGMLSRASGHAVDFERDARP